MENECEALPGVAYSGVRDNRSTINTKTGYDDDDDEDGHFWQNCSLLPLCVYLRNEAINAENSVVEV